jgi:hypothetical protein
MGYIEFMKNNHLKKTLKVFKTLGQWSTDEEISNCESMISDPIFEQEELLSTYLYFQSRVHHARGDITSSLSAIYRALEMEKSKPYIDWLNMLYDETCETFLKWCEHSEFDLDEFYYQFGKTSAHPCFFRRDDFLKIIKTIEPKLSYEKTKELIDKLNMSNPSLMLNLTELKKFKR